MPTRVSAAKISPTYPIYIYIYIYIYRERERYHTMADDYKAALLLTKPSSDDYSGFRLGFRAEASLPLAQSLPSCKSRYHQTLLDCRHPMELPYLR